MEGGGDAGDAGAPGADPGAGGGADARLVDRSGGQPRADARHHQQAQSYQHAAQGAPHGAVFTPYLDAFLAAAVGESENVVAGAAGAVQYR